MTIMNSNSTASKAIFYWTGVIDPENLLVDAKVASVVLDLRNNQCSSGTNLKKLKNHNIYRIKTNDKGRILFTDYQKRGENYLLLLDYLPNHEYNKSKFLKPGILKKFCDYNYNLVDEAEQWEHISHEHLSLFDYPSDESEISFTPVEYYNSTFISFNDHQGNILEESLPLLVSGPPGSGKTCIALSTITRYLSNECNQDNKSVVFVCFSESLANIIRGLWEQQPAYQFVGSTRVIFRSYETLIKELTPELNGFTKVIDEETYAWVSSKIKNTNHLEKKSLIEEFQILSPYNLEEYKGLGERQCLYHNSDVKEEIFELYQQYKIWLSEIGKYDIRFAGTGQTEKYDLVVVDEAQDLSPSALMQLYTLANGNISYFMDTQQDLESSLSKRIHLKQLMYAKGIEMHTKKLATVYRCPNSVLHFANRWLGIKAYSSGGIADKDEYREISLEDNEAIDDGIVSWDVEKFSEVCSNIRYSYKETEIAIVVSQESSKNAEELAPFERHLLFTPEEIKGLEFPVVILFKPFELDVFKQLNKNLQGVNESELQGNRNRPKKNKGKSVSLDSQLPELSKVFTTITRTENTLVIFQPITHSISNIHRLLKPALNHTTILRAIDERGSSSSSSTQPETSREEWLALAEKYLEQGSVNKFNEVCLNKIGVDPEVLKHRMQGPQLQVAASSTNEPPTAELSSVGGEGSSSASRVRPSSSKGKKRSKTTKQQQKSPDTMKVTKKQTIELSLLKPRLLNLNIRKLDKFLESYSIDCRAEDGFTPLMVALIERKIKAAKLFVKKGADLDLQTHEGLTPLMFAAMAGDEKSVWMLLEGRANVDLQAHNGLTALQVAAQNGHEKVVRMLIGAGASIDLQAHNGVTPLRLAAECGHEKVVRMLLEGRANVDLQAHNGATPLMLAAQKGHEKIVQILIGAGASIDLQAHNGFTARLVAAQNGHEKVVRMLIGAGASIDLQAHNGFTALLVAAQNGHEKVVRMLIRAGASIDLQEHNGGTPLMLAAQRGHEKIVQILIGAGASIDLQAHNGDTPLMLAAMAGDEKSVRMLLEEGADANLKESEGKTALNLAAMNGHKEIMQLLINSLLPTTQ
jgi:ankyrin repeat protein